MGPVAHMAQAAANPAASYGLRARSPSNSLFGNALYTAHQASVSHSRMPESCPRLRGNANGYFRQMLSQIHAPIGNASQRA